MQRVVCISRAAAAVLILSCAQGEVTPNPFDADIADGDGDSQGDITPCTEENGAEVCGDRPCVDGYCCNTACDSPCETCDIDGLEGQCSFIEEGTDPHNECDRHQPHTCGQTGECDGHGACAFFGADTACNDDNRCTANDMCDGAGSCAGELPEECAPGPQNVCCHGGCTDNGTCLTEAGTCEETCTEHQLIVGQSCVGCGPAGAEGVCTGGSAHACTEQSHSLCEEVVCNGATYYCNNQDGLWRWRTSVLCDDEDDCTFGGACQGGQCLSTTFTCDSEPCIERTCDGQGGCIEEQAEPGTRCGTTECDPDVCVGGNRWRDFPQDCTSSCNGEGSCDSCSCEATETTCTLGEGNQCCELGCNDATGCHTLPTSCGSGDVCSDNELYVASACEGCGPNGVAGLCGDEQTLFCSAAEHSLCQVAACGGQTYYCTFMGGTWQWRAGDARCDDDDDCTYQDSCGGGACTGVEVICEDTDCMLRACNGTAECTTTPLTGTPCSDGDDCTYGETCTSQGVCPDGTPITCQSDQCITRQCNNSSECAQTIHTDQECNDENACTYGETCSAQGACGNGMTVDCNSRDTTCMDYNCDGTEFCSGTPRNLDQDCDDGNSATDFDVCLDTGVCEGEVGCPPPVESCTNGGQNRELCEGARIIGRTVAGTSGFQIIDNNCNLWGSNMNSDDSCWDGNSDHTYRLYMRRTESVYIRYQTEDGCKQPRWYGTLRIYETNGCDDRGCRHSVYCEYNERDQETTYVAPRDGWIIIVADGSHASDDEGEYQLDVRLTCRRPGCDC